ncbi:MAG: efflux RND transporter periplasmic adaptor subunit [bacterium]|nr:efflux RND transporter periplasmic adaptor subunit [bacterium]
MKIKNYMLLPLLVTIVGCVQEEEIQDVERVTAVRAQIVESSDEKVSSQYTGTLEGDKQAVLYAKISEAVHLIRVSEGEEVFDGRVMIELDKYGPTSQYQQARSTFNVAEKNFKRMEPLFQEGAVSESELDAVRTEYEIARASFEATRKLVEIESPIAGIVTSIDVSAGDYLSAGQLLATVASLDLLRVTFGINPADAASIKIGQPVMLTTHDGLKREGHVTTVASSADPVTRKVDLKLTVENKDHKLRPGLFVRGELVLKKMKDVIAIPRPAVIELSGQNFVFVAQNERAVKRPVQLGIELDGHVVIESGLAVGDSLIVSGQSYLDDDFKVRIISVADSK